jgi:hypothetical protein
MNSLSLPEPIGGAKKNWAQRFSDFGRGWIAVLAQFQSAERRIAQIWSPSGFRTVIYDWNGLRSMAVPHREVTSSISGS